MKLYLSSYKLGNDSGKLIELVNKPSARVAVIDNALDYSTDLDRKSTSLKSEMDSMASLGFSPEHVDLRDYFDDKDDLVKKLTSFEMVWVRGGNSFILLKAMKRSGFETVIEKLIETNKLVYAGYSAALAVISPSLDGVELVDDKDAKAEGYDEEIVCDGFGLIDFYPIVHYKSDHPESKLVDEEMQYIQSKNRKYEVLRDGEAIIIDTDA